MIKLRFANRAKAKGKELMELKKSLGKRMVWMALILVGLSCFFYGWLMQNCVQEMRMAKYYEAIRHLESANMKLEHELRQMEGIYDYSKKYKISVTLAEMIRRVAIEEGVEPGLFFNLIQVESQFKQFAVSKAGAMGYAQLMWPTAKELEPGLKNKAELFIPEVNLRLGARKLRQLLEMWQGNVSLALLSYNRGEGRVIELSNRGENPDNGYPRMVTQ